jgi:pyruvate dehydrogenase (quinone)/pyruvate oxidase
MPGKVSYEQAKGFVKAFLAGQPRRATIASTLFRDKFTEFKS